MAPRKPRPSLADRTPIAEWIAAGLGLILTLAVIGYMLWEGMTERSAPPHLTVTAASATRTGDTYVLPVVVRNLSHSTAADVEVLGVLRQTEGPPEERRARFTYVPGKGEARGGLIFRSDPAAGDLDLSVDGFAEP